MDSYIEIRVFVVKRDCGLLRRVARSSVPGTVPVQSRDVPEMPKLTRVSVADVSDATYVSDGVISDVAHSRREPNETPCYR